MWDYLYYAIRFEHCCSYGNITVPLLSSVYHAASAFLRQQAAQHPLSTGHNHLRDLNIGKQAETAATKHPADGTSRRDPEEAFNPHLPGIDPATRRDRMETVGPRAAVSAAAKVRPSHRGQSAKSSVTAPLGRAQLDSGATAPADGTVIADRVLSVTADFS